MSKKQRFEGIVYSTNTNYDYQEEDVFDEETPAKNHQNLRISLDRKQRGGKSVTLVTGFIGKKEDLDDLGKLIKQKCGVGGSVKDGVILIQGDFKVRILDILHSEGYKAKISGG